MEVVAQIVEQLARAKNAEVAADREVARYQELVSQLQVRAAGLRREAQSLKEQLGRVVDARARELARELETPPKEQTT